jgi:carbon monoxide dehydrogenase subunit G
MPSATHSTDVALNQDEAFALLTDPARFEEWLTLHAGWPKGQPVALAEGDQFVQKLKIMGMPSDISWTVAEVDAPAKLVLKGDGPMGAKLATTLTTLSNGDGTTVTYDAEFAGGGIQGPMGDMVTKKAGEELVVSLVNLKALAG